tara:strand:- start:270 stop:656 length:387 start_codon:yes stop_codon:yes gene_type:complete
MLPKILKPKFIDDLIRLGDKSDGGYVISNKMLKNCKFCLTFGLGDNFSFESDLKKKNPNSKIFVYDHSVSILFWLKHFFFWLWHSVRFRNFNFRFLYFIKYIFFLKYKIIHTIQLKYQKKIILFQKFC